MGQLALDGVGAGFAGPYTNNLLKVVYKDFAIANLAGGGSLDKCLDDGFDTFVFNRNFQAYFRQEIDNVFGAPLKLGVAFLATEAFYFRYCDALHPDRGQRFTYIVQFERLDDRCNHFHVRILGVSGQVARSILS